MMNRTRKGTQGERDVRRWLEDQGFEVYRSTCSAGTFDLIGFRIVETDTGSRIEVRAVQVKRFGKKRSYGRKALLAKLGEWSGFAWITPILAERQDRHEWRYDCATPQS